MSLSVSYESEINNAGSIITLTDTTGAYDASTNPTGYGGGVNKPTSNNIYTEIYFTDTSLGETYVLVLDSTTLPTSDFIPKNALTRELVPADFSEISTADYFLDTLIQIRVFIFFSVAGTHSITTASGVSTITGTTSAYTSVLTGFGDTIYIKVKNGSQNENYTINKESDPAFSNTNIILDQEADITDGAVDVYAGYMALTTIANMSQLDKCFLPKVATLTANEESCCSECGDNVDNLFKILLGKYAVTAMQAQGLYQQAANTIDTINAVCESDCGGCN